MREVTAGQMTRATLDYPSLQNEMHLEREVRGPNLRNAYGGNLVHIRLLLLYMFFRTLGSY